MFDQSFWYYKFLFFSLSCLFGCCLVLLNFLSLSALQFLLFLISIMHVFVVNFFITAAVLFGKSVEILLLGMTSISWCLRQRTLRFFNWDKFWWHQRLDFVLRFVFFFFFLFIILDHTIVSTRCLGANSHFLFYLDPLTVIYNLIIFRIELERCLKELLEHHVVYV